MRKIIILICMTTFLFGCTMSAEEQPIDASKIMNYTYEAIEKHLADKYDNFIILSTKTMVRSANKNHYVSVYEFSITGEQGNEEIKNYGYEIEIDENGKIIVLEEGETVKVSNFDITME